MSTITTDNELVGALEMYRMSTKAGQNAALTKVTTLIQKKADELVRGAERRGEISQLLMLKNWCELHGVKVDIDDIDHILSSLDQFPEQPLASETWRALQQLDNKERGLK